MTPKTYLPVGFLLLLALAPAGASRLEGRGVVMELTETAPLALAALRTAPDGPSLFVGGQRPSPLWAVILHGPQGERVVLNPLENNLGGSVELTGDRLTAAWDPAAVPGGTVRVQCTFSPDPQQPLIYGTITVHNDSAYRLVEVQFPYLTLHPTPGPAERAVIVFPRAYGRSWRNPFNAPPGFLVGTQEPFGHGNPEMQFAAICDDDGHGLYWACHDGEGYQKRMVLDNPAGAGVVDAKFGHVPEDAHQPGNGYSSPFPVVLGAYTGDWWDATHLYRTWALTQKWCRMGPLAGREDIPQWVKEADVWVRGDASRAPVPLEKEFLFDLQEKLGGVIGVQWYSWTDPVNWGDPLVWPPREGWAEMLREAGARGIMGTPYINALQWDVQAASWPAGGEAAFLLDEDGLPMVEGATGAGEPTRICAATKLWHDTLVAACERLVREGHAKGVYFDQLGNQGGIPCWSPDHGHPVGGGTYAVDGLRAICTAVREAMRRHDPEAAVSGEVQPEQYVDVTDFRLVHYNVWPGWVNLWAAVYGDQIPSYGRTIGWAGPLGEGDNFYAATGNTFAAGIQFGRIWPTGNRANWLGEDTWTAQRDFLTLLVDLRRAARPYLTYGRLQRPVRLLHELPTLTVLDGKQRDMAIEAVLSSAWASPEDNLAFVFVNISAEPQHIAWEADLARYEIPAAPAYRLLSIRRDGERDALGMLEGTVLSRSEELAPHSALIVEVLSAD